MLKIDANYTDYRDDTDVQNYPGGKAVDTSTPESIDGTPWKASFFNDLIGARQALFLAAFGSLAAVTNTADTAQSSDVLRAIQKLIKDAFDSKIFQVSVTGEETVIDWNTLGLTYSANNTYACIVTPAGNYEEFLPFGASVENDGVHIFPRRLINGKIIPGTRRVKWGVRKWGVGKWNAYASMNVNLQLQIINN